VATVAKDLGLSESEPAVPVCLKQEFTYNVEEGLAPAILQVLPAARSARYLRCLRGFRRAARWPRLRQQTLGAGRVLWKAGKTWLGRRKT